MEEKGTGTPFKTRGGKKMRRYFGSSQLLKMIANHVANPGKVLWKFLLRIRSSECFCSTDDDLAVSVFPGSSGLQAGQVPTLAPSLRTYARARERGTVAGLGS